MVKNQLNNSNSLFNIYSSNFIRNVGINEKYLSQVERKINTSNKLSV